MNHELCYFRRPITSALSTPAVRTVCICIRTNSYMGRAVGYNGLFWHEDVMPVLAIRSNIFEIYRGPMQSGARLSSDYPCRGVVYLAAPQSLDAGAMSQSGWELQEVAIVDELLVVDPRDPESLISCADIFSDNDDCWIKMRVVSCTWGFEDDAIRFAAIHNDMRRELLQEMADEDEEEEEEEAEEDSLHH